jgi:hypothetical protein
LDGGEVTTEKLLVALGGQVRFQHDLHSGEGILQRQGGRTNHAISPIDRRGDTSRTSAVSPIVSKSSTNWVASAAEMVSAMRTSTDRFTAAPAENLG